MKVHCHLDYRKSRKLSITMMQATSTYTKFLRIMMIQASLTHISKWTIFIPSPNWFGEVPFNPLRMIHKTIHM